MRTRLTHRAEVTIRESQEVGMRKEKERRWRCIVYDLCVSAERTGTEVCSSVVSLLKKKKSYVTVKENRPHISAFIKGAGEMEQSTQVL